MALEMGTEYERCHAPLTHASEAFMFLRVHLLPELHGFDGRRLSQLRRRVGQPPETLKSPGFQPALGAEATMPSGAGFMGTWPGSAATRASHAETAG